jgi:hypothetical protein
MTERRTYMKKKNEMASFEETLKEVAEDEDFVFTEETAKELSNGKGDDDDE